MRNDPVIQTIHVAPAGYKADARRPWRRPVPRLDYQPWPLYFIWTALGCQILLLFLGSTPLRLPLRIGTYGASLLLLWMFPAKFQTHPSLKLLKWVPVIMAIGLVHPLRNTIAAGVGQMSLYVAIFAAAGLGRGIQTEQNNLPRRGDGALVIQYRQRHRRRAAGLLAEHFHRFNLRCYCRTRDVPAGCCQRETRGRKCRAAAMRINGYPRRSRGGGPRRHRTWGGSFPDRSSPVAARVGHRWNADRIVCHHPFAGSNRPDHVGCLFAGAACRADTPGRLGTSHWDWNDLRRGGDCREAHGHLRLVASRRSIDSAR